MVDLVPACVAMLRLPDRVAVLVGAKRTVMVQLAPAANDDAQVVETKLKSAPVTDADVGTVRVITPMPVLVSVAVVVLLPPTCVVLKTGALKVALAA